MGCMGKHEARTTFPSDVACSPAVRPSPPRRRSTDRSELSQALSLTDPRRRYARPVVEVLEVVAFIVGAALVLYTIRAAIRLFLVPRALQLYLARFVFVMVRRVFWLFANHRHDFARRDAVMAFYAPVALLSMFTLWLVLVLMGYTAMYWALGNHPLSFAFTESGSALLTLGFAQGRNLPTIGLMFTEAAIGLGLLAVFIAYLPSLYSAFSRRETGVSKVEVRAGRPPFRHLPDRAGMDRRPDGDPEDPVAGMGEVVRGGRRDPYLVPSAGLLPLGPPGRVVGDFGRGHPGRGVAVRLQRGCAANPRAPVHDPRRLPVPPAHRDVLLDPGPRRPGAYRSHLYPAEGVRRRLRPAGRGRRSDEARP